MVSFNFNGAYAADGGDVSANFHGTQLLASYEGRSGVCYLPPDAWLAFSRNKLPWKQETFVFSISFMIHSQMRGDTVLLCAKGFPLTVSLRRNGTAYAVVVDAELENGSRRCVSDRLVRPGVWTDFTLVVLNGEFFFTLNGEIGGRRVFSGKLKNWILQPYDLYVGRESPDEEGEGFHGYIDSVFFSDSLDSRLAQLSQQLYSDGTGEVESKEEELVQAGVVLGSLVSRKVSLDPASPCRYDRYRNGAIFWSPAYRCVWMSSVIFEKYLEVIKKEIIGLPTMDEAYSEEFGGVYCIFDAAGLFASGSKCVYVRAEFLAAFLDALSSSTPYGFPIEDAQKLTLGETTFSMQRFSDFTLFWVHTVIAVPNIVAEEWRKSAAAYGAPVEYVRGFTGNRVDGYSVGDYYDVSYLVTENSVISFNQITEVTGLDRSQWKTIQKVFPVDKRIFQWFVESGGLNDDFEHIHHAEKYNPFGNHKCFVGPPGRTPDGVVYQNCLYGTILRWGDDENCDVRGFTYIKVTLNEISCGSINDAEGLNKAPELYITAEALRNGKTEYEKTRYPKYKKGRKHGGSGFTITNDFDDNVRYRFGDIKGEDVIRIKIEAYDYDPVGDNDKLASYDLKLTAATGWGLYKDFVGEENHEGGTDTYSGTAISYHNIYATKAYDDNRKGRKNTWLTINISCGSVPYDLNAFFRKYGYWSIDNFKSRDNISRDLFNRTFSASTGSWYDWILHFWDEVWFHAAQDIHSGKDGNCYGMSLEALLALHDKSTFRLPLSDWKLYSDEKLKKLKEYGLTPDPNEKNGFLEWPGSEREKDADFETKRANVKNCSYSDEINPAFFEVIRQRHMSQIGWDCVQYYITQAVIGHMFNPTMSFRDIIRMLRSERYCILNCFGDGGHSMLAYKYEAKSDDDRNAKIFVADPNNPWWKYPDAPDSSYVCLTSGDYPKVQLHYGTNGDYDTYPYCYGVPYRVATKSPRVPSWLELAGLALASIIILPTFLITNLVDLIYVLASGDEVTAPDGKDGSENGFSVPVFDLALPTVSGSSMHIMCFQGSEVSLNVAGKDNGDFSFFVGRRNKLLNVNGNTGRLRRVLDVKKFNSRKPDIAFKKTVGPSLRSLEVAEAPTLQMKEVALKSSGMQAKPAPMKTPQALKKIPSLLRTALPREAEEISELTSTAYSKKIYYLNTTPHWRKPSPEEKGEKEYEMHTEDCPYLHLIKYAQYLGLYENDEYAIHTAFKMESAHVNGCRYCCQLTDTDLEV